LVLIKKINIITTTIIIISQRKNKIYTILDKLTKI